MLLLLLTALIASLVGVWRLKYYGLSAAGPRGVVSTGMNKSDVANIMGERDHGGTVNGRDYWEYFVGYDRNGRKEYVVVYFEKDRVVEVKPNPLE
jgi:hypothetical protein